MQRAKHEQRNHFLFRHRLTNDQLHDVEVYSGPITVQGRQLLYSIIHDITERKKTEQALQESMTSFRAAMDSSIAGHFIIKDFKFHYANSKMHEFFGYEPGEMVAKLNPLDMVVEKDRAKVKRNIKLREKGLVAPAYELMGLRKDNSVFNGLVLGSVIQYQGEAAIYGTLIDITARKQAEKALAHHRDQLERLV